MLEPPLNPFIFAIPSLAPVFIFDDAPGICWPCATAAVGWVSCESCDMPDGEGGATECGTASGLPVVTAAGPEFGADAAATVVVGAAAVPVTIGGADCSRAVGVGAGIIVFKKFSTCFKSADDNESNFDSIVSYNGSSGSR